MGKEPTLSDVEGFLDRFRRLMKQTAAVRLAGFKAGFGHLAAGMRAILSLMAEIERVTAPEHNLLRILGVALDEDHTHTPILAHLFDPNGSHGQKHLYLEGLLKLCGNEKEFSLPEGDIRTASWFVETQKVIGFGILDLVIKCPRLKYLLVIENKVGVSEQKLQLSRYHDWMQTQQRFYPQQTLVYLTPQGREAVSAEGCKYVRLSYRHHIAKMLKELLPSTQAPCVRETIRQYLAIIETL